MQDDQDDTTIIMPKKKGLPGKKTTPDSPNKISPVMEVMKAAAKAAQNPGKKKKDPIKSGPSKSNLKKPQKAGRIDKGDGPSAEDEGEA